MALPNFGTGDPKLFATKRSGRTPVVLEPKTLAKVVELLTKHGIVQGETFYTASKAETEAYNGKRETAAKTAGKEAPVPITLAGMAVINARKDAVNVQPYVDEAVDTTFTNKSSSLRFVDQGTEDHPKVLWAFVLVNPRVRAPKTPDAPAS